MTTLFFSDLDETLLVNHHVPSENLEAIERLKKTDTKFVVCTGRSYPLVIDVLKELGTYHKAGDYTICLNGGMIVENETDRILYYKGLAFGTAKTIVYQGVRHDLCMMIFTLDHCYLMNATTAEIDRKKAQHAEFTVVEGDSIDFLKGKDIAKVIYVDPDLDKLKAYASALNLTDIDVTCSSGRYLEIIPKGVNKGTGIQWLANYLKIPMEKTMGIGDSDNDYEMITTCHIGISTAGACDRLKQQSSYITTVDYDKGAVKEAIEKFVL